MEEVGKAGPTPQQITAIKAAIQNAQTLKEVEELEKALVTGHVPSEFKVTSSLLSRKCKQIFQDSMCCHLQGRKVLGMRCMRHLTW